MILQKKKKTQKKRKGLSIMSHLFCFFSLEDTYFHFVPSLTNYQTTPVAACPLPKPALPAVADPEANGRAHPHNTVTFHEWPLVTHGSGLHIPHLSECKVRVAIFIERNRVGGGGNGVLSPSVCPAAPEILSAQNKSVFGNFLLCSFDTDK